MATQITSINPLWLVTLALAVSFLPLICALGSCYLKVSIALGMLRNALGAQQLPGNVVIISLSIALSTYLMGPVFSACAARLQSEQLKLVFANPSLEALSKFSVALEPWNDFLRQHSGERELRALSKLETERFSKQAVKNESAEPQIQQQLDKDKLPFRVLLAAFALTELKEAFALGFILLLPFLVVDLIVANILAAMGMFMLSPLVISLPLKVFFFVMCDGWILITRGLIHSY